MVYLADDEKQLGNEQDPNQQGQQTGGQELSGSSGGDVGSGVSTAGVGKGGTGGWTNIQSYLKANEGNTSSADALNKEVGGAFDSEKDKLLQDSSKQVNDAQSKLNAQKQVTDDNAAFVNGAKSSYQWGGNQSDDYNNKVNQGREALSQYSGPSNYSYAQSAQAQNYGSGLNNGFDSLMKDIYGKAAGRPLTTGQAALQNQIDTGNDALAGVRQNLIGKYSDLGNTINQTVTDTNSKLGDVSNQYNTNRDSLSNYLYGHGSDLTGQIQTAENAARDNYRNDLNSQSGFSFSNPVGYSGLGDSLHDAGFQWGSNLSNQQVSDLVNAFNQNGDWKNSSDGQKIFNRANATLNNFNTGEDTKYSNAADDQEREYNTILDFLNSTEGRKEQGFKYKG